MHWHAIRFLPNPHTHRCPAVLPPAHDPCCTRCTPVAAAGTYKVIATGQAVSIHPSSVLHGRKPQCIVFSELVRTARQYARDATLIDPAWLPELAPAFFARQQANSGGGGGGGGQ